ncbi:PadR family transcriptional regulator [Paenibacillus sp. P26]|nr:PadR family transcriptional regulator [Paenibacillus sp. P26]UUZ93679.1 PadR family transcriptional regulator [Paenibacillus sp. P25]
MSIKLVVLGLLSREKLHPYEIKRLLKEKKLEKFVKINDGTLYYTIDRLTKDGYIEPVETVQDPNRPEKTLYAITGAGKARFFEELYEAFGQTETFCLPGYSAMLFLEDGDPEEVRRSLQVRLKRSLKDIATMEGYAELYRDHPSRGVQFMLRNAMEHYLVERKTLEDLIRHLNVKR